MKTSRRPHNYGPRAFVIRKPKTVALEEKVTPVSKARGFYDGNAYKYDDYK